jgi:hypothetical protein
VIFDVLYVPVGCWTCSQVGRAALPSLPPPSPDDTCYGMNAGSE